MADLPDEGLNGDDAVERKNWIDAGTYNVQIINSNRKDKDNGLVQLAFQFQVLDGPHEKETFWLNFNYVNPNSQQNQDISRDQLALITKVCGAGFFKKTEDLHEKPFCISVKVKEDGGYTNNTMTSAREFQNGGVSAKPAPKSTEKGPAAKAPAKAAAGASPGTKGPGGKPWNSKK